MVCCIELSFFAQKPSHLLLEQSYNLMACQQTLCFAIFCYWWLGVRNELLIALVAAMRNTQTTRWSKWEARHVRNYVSVYSKQFTPMSELIRLDIIHCILTIIRHCTKAEMEVDGCCTLLWASGDSWIFRESERYHRLAGDSSFSVSPRVITRYFSPWHRRYRIDIFDDNHYLYWLCFTLRDLKWWIRFCHPRTLAFILLASKRLSLVAIGVMLRLPKRSSTALHSLKYVRSQISSKKQARRVYLLSAAVPADGGSLKMFDYGVQEEATPSSTLHFFVDPHVNGSCML
jgi:hypothetical protein